MVLRNAAVRRRLRICTEGCVRKALMCLLVNVRVFTYRRNDRIRALSAEDYTEKLINQNSLLGFLYTKRKIFF